MLLGNVNDYCLPIGYMCERWEMFVEGRCVNCENIDDIRNCQLMGFFPAYFKIFELENKQGVGQKYYLNTAKGGNYCSKHCSYYFINYSNSVMAKGVFSNPTRIKNFQKSSTPKNFWNTSSGPAPELDLIRIKSLI